MLCFVDPERFRIAVGSGWDGDRVRIGKLLGEIRDIFFSDPSLKLFAPDPYSPRSLDR